MKEIEITEREAFIMKLSDDVAEAIMGVLTPHDLTVSEGLTVIASAIIDILDTLADITHEDKRNLRELFANSFTVDLKADISGTDIVKLTDINKKRRK